MTDTYQTGYGVSSDVNRALATAPAPPPSPAPSSQQGGVYATAEQLGQPSTTPTSPPPALPDRAIPVPIGTPLPGTPGGPPVADDSAPAGPVGPNLAADFEENREAGMWVPNLFPAGTPGVGPTPADSSTAPVGMPGTPPADGAADGVTQGGVANALNNAVDLGAPSQ